MICLSQSSLFDLLTRTLFFKRAGYGGNRADALTWGHKVFLSLVLSVRIYLDICLSLRQTCTSGIAIMYIAVLITCLFFAILTISLVLLSDLVTCVSVAVFE